MTAPQLVALGALLCLTSGLFPVLLGARWSRVGLGTILVGTLVGLSGCVLGLGGTISTMVAPWQVPGGSFRVTVDALAAFFALPVFVLGACGAVYAERYWPAEQPRGRQLRLFFQWRRARSA